MVKVVLNHRVQDSEPWLLRGCSFNNSFLCLQLFWKENDFRCEVGLFRTFRNFFAFFYQVKNDDSQSEENSSESEAEELTDDVPDETDDVETGEIEKDNVDSEDEAPSEDTVE